MRWLIGLLALALALIPQLCSAGVSDSTCRISVAHSKCNRNVFGDVVSCSPYLDWGSGTAIANQSGQTYIATCRHIFDAARAANWSNFRATVYSGGKAMQARLIDVDPRYDLALLLVNGVIPAAEIDGTDEDLSADELQAAGYPFGRPELTSSRQRIVNVDRNGNLITDSEIHSGMSGGGLFRRGRLVGVLWGCGNVEKKAYATDSRLLKSMVEKHRIRCRYYHGRNRLVAPTPPFRDSSEPPPVVPPGVPPPPIEPGKEPAPAPLPPERGQTGPPGPPGPPGPVANLDEIKQRLSALEARQPIPGQAGPPGTVTVILIGPDGKEAKRQSDVKAGSIVRVNVSEIISKGNGDG